MEIVPFSYTIADYCADLDTNAIQVDRRYQRSDEVWPASAQSFLIETILLGFPVPKLYLYQLTDRISKKTIKYIVDGQQRSVAIKAFYDDELRLSRKLEYEDAAGRYYTELPPELQDRFLSYGLGVDLIVNTNEDEVREIFRRINSYEVPLNPEEQRHARFQGEFKWYIYRLSTRLDDVFIRLGTFSGKQIVRMQDMKLLAELSHALIYGITTTNKRTLDALYRDNDDVFPQANPFARRIESAVEFLDALESLHETSLMKTYSLYSLLLAVMHVRRAVPSLAYLEQGEGGIAGGRTCERRLSLLAEAVDEGVVKGRFRLFVKASQTGTNVKRARETRFLFFVDALRRDGGTRFRRL